MNRSLMCSYCGRCGSASQATPFIPSKASPGGPSRPGFTTLFYHPDLDAVVVMAVNGDYPPNAQTVTDGPRDIPCETPHDRIFAALTEALGKPFPPNVLSET